MPDIDPRLEACMVAARAAGAVELSTEVDLVRAIIDTWLLQASTDKMDAAGEARCDYCSGDSVYTAMCAQARKEIAGG